MKLKKSVELTITFSGDTDYKMDTMEDRLKGFAQSLEMFLPSAYKHYSFNYTIKRS